MVDLAVGYATGRRRPGHRATRYHRLRVGIASLDLCAVLLAALAGCASSEAFGEPSSGWAFLIGPPVWFLSLVTQHAYDIDVVRVGCGKAASQIMRAAIVVVAVVATLGLVAGTTTPTPQIFVGVPLAAFLTLAFRGAATAWLRAFRWDEWVRRTLVVGEVRGIVDMLAVAGRDKLHGLHLVGGCLVGEATAEDVAAIGVPIRGTAADTTAAAIAADCSAVLVLPSARLDAVRLRRMAWELHAWGLELIVAPNLTGVTRGRVGLHQIGDAAVVHVRQPVRGGVRHLVKTMLEKAVTAALIVATGPLMTVVAFVIRCTSPGPALIRQARVGRNGRAFTCLKFRTMVVDAETRRAEYEHLNAADTGPLFKIRNDPRITKVGGVLRHFSIDELPQLFNVLKGDMSLVGPRPPLPAEVASYDADVRRRLLVKPGLTGLWQVSGRSDLPWAESVRLDLHYVDNWSLGMDLRILLRTVSAVARGTGAY